MDLCLRVLKNASEAPLSEKERAAVRRVALAILDTDLGLGPGEGA
jgi:hypothetical protein